MYQILYIYIEFAVQKVISGKATSDRLMFLFFLSFWFFLPLHILEQIEAQALSSLLCVYLFIWCLQSQTSAHERIKQTLQAHKRRRDVTVAGKVFLGRKGSWHVVENCGSNDFVFESCSELLRGLDLDSCNCSTGVPRRKDYDWTSISRFRFFRVRFFFPFWSMSMSFLCRGVDLFLEGPLGASLCATSLCSLLCVHSSSSALARGNGQQLGVRSFRSFMQTSSSISIQNRTRNFMEMLQRIHPCCQMESKHAKSLTEWWFLFSHILPWTLNLQDEIYNVLLYTMVNHHFAPPFRIICLELFPGIFLSRKSKCCIILAHVQAGMPWTQQASSVEDFVLAIAFAVAEISWLLDQKQRHLRSSMWILGLWVTARIKTNPGTVWEMKVCGCLPEKPWVVGLKVIKQVLSESSPPYEFCLQFRYCFVCVFLSPCSCRLLQRFLFTLLLTVGAVFCFCFANRVQRATCAEFMHLYILPKTQLH